MAENQDYQYPIFDGVNFDPQFLVALQQILLQNTAAGFTGTVALAPLSMSGTEGSLTVVKGVITTYVAPT